MTEKIENHVEQAKARQTQFFKNKENIDKILELQANRMQLLENILFRFLSELSLDSAVGAQLDGIGTYYGDQGLRNGRADEDYRAVLKVLPQKIRQAGQHEVLINAFLTLVPNTTKIIHAYYYPRACSFIAKVDSYDLVTNKNDVDDQMQAIRAQGVNLDVGLTLNSGAFQLSGDPSGSVPTGTGLSNSTSGNGGTLSLLLSD